MSPRTGAGVGVGSWIERQARIAPDKRAMVFAGRSVSYAQMAARIRRLANGLRALGVGRGDRIAWTGPNHPAFLEAFFAVGQLGGALATANHRLGLEEQGRILELTEPVVLVHFAVTPAHAPSIRHRICVAGPPAPGGVADPGVVPDLGAAGAGTPLPPTVDYETLVAASDDAAIDERVSLDDVLFLPHTSGTTSAPKAVTLTHGNVTWNAIDVLTLADLRRDDVTVAIAPFFRVGGSGVNVLPVLLAGGTIVVPDDSQPDALLGLLETYRVTVGFGNPDLLDALVRAERWPTADLSSIRFMMTGGASVPERLIRTYLERGVALLQGYGLSEAAPVVLLLGPDLALRKVGSAGRPPLFVDIRVVDDGGRDVAFGQAGELLARGPNIMAGYWRRPVETRLALDEDGWLHTGDAARMDADGDVWIVDRLEARYVSAGEPVFPGDIEQILLEHPAVADAGVVGLPNPDGDASGAAFVVRVPGADATPDELLAHCQARLPAHAVPATIAFVDALPRNAVGKLLRRRLAAMAVEEKTGDAPP